jgi:hypothetical protein
MLAMSLRLAIALAAVPALSAAPPPLPRGRTFVRFGEHYLVSGSAFLVAEIRTP